jgi:hypothetical protein
MARCPNDFKPGETYNGDDNAKESDGSKLNVSAIETAYRRLKRLDSSGDDSSTVNSYLDTCDQRPAPDDFGYEKKNADDPDLVARLRQELAHSKAMNRGKLAMFMFCFVYWPLAQFRPCLISCYCILL